MKNQDEQIIWKKRRGDRFETFAVELEEFTKTGRLPESCDQDMNYCLELQRERQREKGILMKYEFVPRGHFAEGGGIGRGFEDAHYKTRMEYRTCCWEKTFYQDKRSIYSSKENTIFYQMITDTQDSYSVEMDNYVCPNCGAISQVKELINGCSYCKTFFKMEDLFPKTTNFYMIKDYGHTEKEVNASIFKTMFPCMVAFFVIFSFIYNTQNDNGILINMISGLFAGIFGGGIFGYFIWAIRMLCGIFAEAGKSIPMVANSFGSTKRFEEQMKRYSPEFSYEYFTSKVISMLKMLIYAKNPNELPFYEGVGSEERFSDIVDSSYRGALALKNFSVQDKYCYVTVDAYMETLYYENKICKRNDKYQLVLRKNITTPIQMNFSIKKISCKSCGISFDATKRRSCPSCNAKYDIADEDWVIMKIQN
jgi:hypothetical protein